MTPFQSPLGNGMELIFENSIMKFLLLCILGWNALNVAVFTIRLTDSLYRERIVITTVPAIGSLLDYVKSADHVGNKLDYLGKYVGTALGCGEVVINIAEKMAPAMGVVGVGMVPAMGVVGAGVNAVKAGQNNAQLLIDSVNKLRSYVTNPRPPSHDKIIKSGLISGVGMFLYSPTIGSVYLILLPYLVKFGRTASTQTSIQLFVACLTSTFAMTTFCMWSNNHIPIIVYFLQCMREVGVIIMCIVLAFLLTFVMPNAYIMSNNRGNNVTDFEKREKRVQASMITLQCAVDVSQNLQEVTAQLYSKSQEFKEEVDNMSAKLIVGADTKNIKYGGWGAYDLGAKLGFVAEKEPQVSILLIEECVKQCRGDSEMCSVLHKEIVELYNKHHRDEGALDLEKEPSEAYCLRVEAYSNNAEEAKTRSQTACT